MLTPQKVWSGWRLPRKEGTGSGSGHGKEVASAEPVTPVGESGGRIESSLAPMSRDGLLAKISQLQDELYDYQYNMGLLLIEKKEWTSKLEELGKEIADAKEALKREQAAHLIAIDEVEKREENLRKALGVEKQCVLDLEKALREMRSEHAEIKFTADSKLAEANALVTSVEEKSLEVEVKLCSADAKLAEVSRRSSEVERKVQDVEARENALRGDRLSFLQEREAHDTTLSQQREDLREWERKLQEREERLAESQRLLNQREERVNDNDRIIKQREKDLEESQKKIDASLLSLGKKEDEIAKGMSDLVVKEKEYDKLRQDLEMKEKELLALEEKLNEREKAEIQKLNDEHNALLEAKRSEIEMEFAQKRKSLDEELKSRLIEVERKEAEISHVEEKLERREKALEKKMEKLKEKEKDQGAKQQALREKEKAIRVEEKNLETEQQKMLFEKENLICLKAEVEKIRAENEQEILRIREEEARLRVTEEERLDFTRLQSELKQAMDECRQQKEVLLKEVEDMKEQKESFEKEWDELDEKRTEIEKMLKKLSDQKENFEKVKHSEEERLSNEKLKTDNYMQRELEDLRLAKESFEATMEHEKLLASEQAQNEKRKMLDDLEQQKRDLEADFQNRQETMEKQLREREKLFEEEREKELNNINFEREMAKREMEELKVERLKMDKEMKALAENKEKLVAQQAEMWKDIDQLFVLSRKLKEQREQLIREREHFISFVESQKSCKNCGEIICESVLSELQSLRELDSPDVVCTPKLAGEYLKDRIHGNSVANASQQFMHSSSGVVPLGSPTSGGMSWLRKCTSKIFKFSPVRKVEAAIKETSTEEASKPGEQVDRNEPNELLKRLDGTGNEPELPSAVADGSRAVEKTQQDDIKRELEDQEPSIDDQSNLNSQAEIPEHSQPLPSKNGRRKLGNKGGSKVHRTRTVKAVVEEAKVILGNTADCNGISHADGDAEDSGQINADSHGGSSTAVEGKQQKLRKRTRAQTSQSMANEHDGDDSEVRSAGVKANRRQRRKVASVVQTPGDARYNFRRRPKKEVAVGTANTESGLNREVEEDDADMQHKDENSNGNVALASEVGVDNENGGSEHFVQSGAVEKSEDAGANSSRKVVEDLAMSEEVSGTPKKTVDYGGRDEYRTESDEEDRGVEGEDDEEDEHPGEVSIGKKLWTFLTT